MLATLEYEMSLINHQLLSMALAYLELGEIASSTDKEIKDNSEYQNAVAYQLYHAIELFYKYMIKIKTGKINEIHDLAELGQEYRKLYPGPEYNFEHPFDFSNYESSIKNPNEEVFKNKHLNKFKPKYMDQHLRYPADYRTGGYSYSIESSYFNIIKEKMLSLSTTTTTTTTTT